MHIKMSLREVRSMIKECTDRNCDCSLCQWKGLCNIVVKEESL